MIFFTAIHLCCDQCSKLLIMVDITGSWEFVRIEVDTGQQFVGMKNTPTY